MSVKGTYGVPEFVPMWRIFITSRGKHFEIQDGRLCSLRQVDVYRGCFLESTFNLTYVKGLRCRHYHRTPTGKKLTFEEMKEMENNLVETSLCRHPRSYRNIGACLIAEL